MSGLSVRLALALGLHLRNEDDSMNDSKREPLVKTWWCLHSIECLVSSITGRPPVIGNEDCTVTLPQYEPGSPVRDTTAARQSSRIRTSYSTPQTPASSAVSDSDQRHTDGSHYLHTYVTLTIISQKVLLSLYSPRTAVQSWEVSVLSLYFDQLPATDPCVCVCVCARAWHFADYHTYSTYRQRSRSCLEN